jgi:hypothetical protein
MADEAGKAQERGELFSANGNRVRAADTASLDDIGISRPKCREVRDAGTHAFGLQIPKPRGSKQDNHARSAAADMPLPDSAVGRGRDLWSWARG